MARPSTLLWPVQAEGHGRQAHGGTTGQSLVRSAAEAARGPRPGPQHVHGTGEGPASDSPVSPAKVYLLCPAQGICVTLRPVLLERTLPGLRPKLLVPLSKPGLVLSSPSITRSRNQSCPVSPRPSWTWVA